MLKPDVRDRFVGSGVGMLRYVRLATGWSRRDSPAILVDGRRCFSLLLAVHSVVSDHVKMLPSLIRRTVRQRQPVRVVLVLHPRWRARSSDKRPGSPLDRTARCCTCAVP